jgi:hypothetical protein
MFVLAVVALMVVPILPAAAAPTQLRFRGDIAFTEWFDTRDPTGCVQTGARLVLVNATRHEPPGPPTTGTEGFVEIVKFDWCQNLYILDAIAVDPQLSDGALQMERDLSSATLNDTIEMCDWVGGSCFPVSFALTWTATGPATGGSSHYHSNDGTVMVHFSDRTRSRPAQVSGVISDGATNYAETPTSGFLTSQASAQITVD